ncbi:aromatic amino acid beta-eliminating lyase/threonine aldolase [Thermodesulfobium narugense DSM 14796]|uniref:glycine dehydrogenase (aminomethyl-transferring) n=1 Tax=Thermodesulfobium narugense DSM 14796 TaxID=747365 RepID=M1E857_9BACT|nr:aminomethyl-transferring glycine dehydrogenase subunit GcvPB [Thermodesulfobium narugense]AEE14770.1 aromatic amino acid beta-eliminating lyase/threonine aldolase [Thermodesulfobium narugense DSM 14796]
MKLIFEESKSGRKSFNLPESDVNLKDFPGELSRSELNLPEVSELDLIRHFINLSRLNFSVDTQFYPLGSCTMKYNPKILEKAANIPEFLNLHPFLSILPDSIDRCKGALELISDFQDILCEITGMDYATINPMAGAHGELTGIMIISSYHKSRNSKRTKVIVPDSSHGTNPASASMVGYEVVTIPSNSEGEMDVDELKKHLDTDVAAVMMTCPNTLGLFEKNIKEISDLAHSVGALMYYDGANLNAIMGKVRPGDLGFDVIHVNVHKTFGTPHGGGGPGAGPVGVKKFLEDFLPIPRVKREGDSLVVVSNSDKSIGHISSFFGNFAVILKAYLYIKLLGTEGIKYSAEMAVLNANYVMNRLKGYLKLPYDRTCMHECVFSLSEMAKKGASALDFAKFLIDRGFHPPTIYFPLIVKEAFMIEPTETESKETLDKFIGAIIDAVKLAEQNPVAFKELPKTTVISRPDETKAAKDLVVKA